MLDVTKPVETRGGRPARIICTSAAVAGVRSIIALIGKDGPGQMVRSYLPSGLCNPRVTLTDDLVQAKVPLPVRFLSFYRQHNGGINVLAFESKTKADNHVMMSGNVRIATVEVKGFEGDGLPVPPPPSVADEDEEE